MSQTVPPSSTESDPVPGPVGVSPTSKPPGKAASPRNRTGVAAAWLAVTLAVVAALLGWFAMLRTSDLEQRFDQERTDNLAREQRSSERDRQLADIERQWTQAQSEADVAAGQMTDVDLRRRREALALIDIERVVEQAQLQLRLGAPTGVAVEALLAVDARLGRLSGAGASHVQVALRHDLARLKSAPDLDRGSLAARLDPLLKAVDGWHPTADVTHPSQRPPAVGPAAGTRTGPADAGHESVGAQIRDWISREFGDLLRIREVDTPEALRLGPAQQQLLRDRFRLGILDLREAILARDERTIRAEDAALETLLTRYFDPNQAEVAAAITQLRATTSAAAPVAAPSLDETLGALRAARSGAGG